MGNLTPKKLFNITAVLVVLAIVIGLFTDPSAEDQKKAYNAENAAVLTKIEHNKEKIALQTAKIAKHQNILDNIEALYAEKIQRQQNILDEVTKASKLKLENHNKLGQEYVELQKKVAKEQAMLNKLHNFDELEKQKLAHLAELQSKISIFSAKESQKNSTKYTVSSDDKIFLVRYIFWDRQEIVYIRQSLSTEPETETLFSVHFSELDEPYKKSLLNNRETAKYIGIDWNNLGEKAHLAFLFIDYDTGVRWYDTGKGIATKWKPFSSLNKAERTAYESLIASKQEK